MNFSVDRLGMCNISYMMLGTDAVPQSFNRTQNSDSGIDNRDKKHAAKLASAYPVIVATTCVVSIRKCSS